MEYVIAETEEEFEAAAKLFRLYATWLKVDLCFQNFDDEMLQLPIMYGQPSGAIILVKEGNKFIGCVGIRPLKNEEGAELKRMYLLPEFQDKGIGSILLHKSFEVAKELGYKIIKLDTLSTMHPAMRLYEKNGFVQTKSYYHNPLADVVYFEKDL